MNSFELYTDGGSRGNPGPSAIGSVLINPQTKAVVWQNSQYIGETTNNTAEYGSLITSLKWIVGNWQELGVGELTCKLDSELVVKQILKIYKVKHPNIIPLFAAVNQQVDLLKKAGILVRFKHIPRAENKLADGLVNKALDEKMGEGL